MKYYYQQQQQQHQQHYLQNGGSITQFFQGAPNQRGHGVGSFLGGMFRTIAPVIKSGIKAVGSEALKTGVGFLRDMADGTMDPKVAANARMRQFTESLKRRADDKMSRVLNGGGAGGRRRIGAGICAKRRRVARKSNAQRATRKAKRAMRGGGPPRATKKNQIKSKKKKSLKVTPQSLTRLLRGKTYNSVNRHKSVPKRKKKNNSVRDIFS